MELSEETIQFFAQVGIGIADGVLEPVIELNDDSVYMKFMSLNGIHDSAQGTKFREWLHAHNIPYEDTSPGQWRYIKLLISKNEFQRLFPMFHP